MIQGGADRDLEPALVRIRCPVESCNQLLQAQSPRGLLDRFRDHMLDRHGWNVHRSDGQFWRLTRPEWFRQ